MSAEASRVGINKKAISCHQTKVPPPHRMMALPSRRVYRYSSMHEKEIPDGSIRRRMELHRTPPARPQGIRTAQDPQPSRDSRRRLLPPEKRLPVAALAPPLPHV